MMCETITPPICGEYLSFFTLFGPHPQLDQKPTNFAAKNFFLFVLQLVLDRKSVPPRNPAPGATIVRNVTGWGLRI